MHLKTRPEDMLAGLVGCWWRWRGGREPNTVNNHKWEFVMVRRLMGPQSCKVLENWHTGEVK